MTDDACRGSSLPRRRHDGLTEPEVPAEPFLLQETVPVARAGEDVDFRWPRDPRREALQRGAVVRAVLAARPEQGPRPHARCEVAGGEVLQRPEDRLLELRLRPEEVVDLLQWVAVRPPDHFPHLVEQV